MDYSSKEEVYQALRDWEYENGESILDNGFGSYIKETTFMTWALGKGYTTPEKFDMWYNKYLQNDFTADELQQFLYDDYGEIEYALIRTKDGEWHEEEYEQSYRILAHFITDFIVYQKKLAKFFEEYNV